MWHHYWQAITSQKSSEMNNYYRRYGKQMGFGTSLRSSSKDKNRELRYVTLTCGREGKTRTNGSNPINLYPGSKMQCKLGYVHLSALMMESE